MLTQTVTNQLSKERSPYLQAAAHQPVQWYPWSPEAFREAQRLDRPILLDIGAAWCHWCHVMDRESYENEEIATIINESFVAIKVDRDERPEIDTRYQTSVGALTGQGGWPLTAFLTPQGEAFYGGTYFPPDDSYGQPGFKRILKRIAELYGAQKADILEDAKKISALFEVPPGEPVSRDALTSERVEQCRSALKHHFDFAHGGFGNAPKFFHPAALEFLLNQFFFSREAWLRAVLEKTLYAMGKGGVYDQLGGGFHRYSVDERWVVPHFEKMSYDNAALLSIYVKAFHLLEKPYLREIALGILRWSRDTMTDTGRGGFYASQDADVNFHDDGDYYTWTEREVESLLTKEEASALLPHFDIEAQGEMHHDPSRNVLFVAREPEILARELELKPQEVIQRIESAKRKLLEARAKRKIPFVDQTLYTNWNGLWIQSYFTASRFLGDSSLKDFALKTLDRFRRNGFIEGQGMVRSLSEEGNPPEGLLEDQVEMLAAALDAFEITGVLDYLKFAQALAKILIERFNAPEGGFFDIPASKDEGHLRIRQRRIQDSPTASSNATAALSLLRLYHLTQEGSYLEKAEALLEFFHEEAKSLSYFAAGYVTALDFYLKGATKVVLVGKRTNPQFERLLQSALSLYRPFLVILPIPPESQNFFLEPALLPLYEEERRTGRVLARVCRGKTCLAVTESALELVRQIMEKL